MKIFSHQNGVLVLALACTLFSACTSNRAKVETAAGNTKPVQLSEKLEYAEAQVRIALEEIPAYDSVPRNITPGKKQWNYVKINDWTSGFWPGILWYTYEHSGDKEISVKAEAFTQALHPILVQYKWDHDLGFMFYCSYGNGYRLTKNPAYKEVLLEAADSLVTLYNPNVGTILSWPGMVKKMDWPHNTIVDNMMNLELLFWAAKNGRKEYYDLAVRHAEVTMKNHIRPDNSLYHVAVYDDKTGEFIKGVTHQGYADHTMWARGQSWGIYGFTMSYRETGRKDFLETAQRLADRFLERLPEDMVPYWDFDAPNIPDEPKDASAAAITASALLELSTMGDSQELKDKYRAAAVKMLNALTSDKYLSRDQNNAFLLHSTGHRPAKSEVDVSIIYADYYFIEALLRLKRLNAGEKVAGM